MGLVTLLLVVILIWVVANGPRARARGFGAVAKASLYGGAVGLAAALVGAVIVLPALGARDEMSRGLGGVLLVAVLVPLGTLLGGVSALRGRRPPP